MMKRLFFLLLLPFLAQRSVAQELTAIADSQQIMIGSPFRLNLSASFPKSQPPVFFAVDSIAHFEILFSSPVDTQSNGDAVKLTQTLTLTSWDSGQWSIPSYAIGKVKTQPIKINVVFQPSPFDRNQPYHDIKDIKDVKKPRDSKWYWYFIFAVMLIALFMLFFPGEKKKKDEKPAPAVDPYKKALRELETLENSTSEDPRQFYTHLVSVFREYLSVRRNIRSHSKTTDDLAIQLETLPIKREEYQKLLQTLRLSDLVKFAQFRPAESETREAVRTIKESIIIIEHEKDVV